MKNKNSNETNGFMVFMYEFMSKQKNIGNLNLSDQINKASPHWDALSTEEREPYNQKAKAQNAANKAMTTNNVPIAGPSRRTQNTREITRSQTTTQLTEKQIYMMKQLTTLIEYNIYYQSKKNYSTFFINFF